MAKIKTETHESADVVHLEGQFSGGDETDELHASLMQVARSSAPNAIIDLEKATFLNSTALGILITINSMFMAKDGKLILANVSKALENIFIITKLNLVFNISGTIEGALKELS